MSAELTPTELARMVDHTLLKPDATEDQVAKLCDEALSYYFVAICVAPTWIRFAAERLQESNTVIATVIGFPLGNTLPDAKAHEARCALEEGALELDMVINIGALKDGNEAFVHDDIAGVVAVARERKGVLVKVILENALLSNAEKELGCKLCENAGADFVKTSTGFAKVDPPKEPGATLEDVELFKRMVDNRIGIKAAGGIRNLDDVESIIRVLGKVGSGFNAHKTRIGCSSSVQIMEELIDRVSE